MTRTIVLIILLLYCIPMDASARHRKPKKKIEPQQNVIRATVGIGDIGGYPTINLGGEYERFIVSNNMLSFIVPLYVYNGGDLSLGEYGYNDRRSRLYGIYTAPGLRFHPLGNKHRVDPGVGISVPLGYANRRDKSKDWNGKETIGYSHELFAAIVGHAGIDIHTTKGFTYGFCVSIGRLLSNTVPTFRAGTNVPDYVIVSFRFNGMAANR